MKGITKDSEILRKITKVFFTVGKINVKYFWHYISVHTLHFPSISCHYPTFRYNSNFLNCLLKSPIFMILLENLCSYYFMVRHLHILRYITFLFYVNAACFHS